MAVPDHYMTLKIECDASDEDIKQAFRHLAKKFHPDNTLYWLPNPYYDTDFHFEQMGREMRKAPLCDHLLCRPFHLWRNHFIANGRNRDPLVDIEDPSRRRR